MARTASRSIDVGALIGTTFSTWLRNLLPFTILAAIVLIPQFGLEYYISQQPTDRNGLPSPGLNFLRLLVTLVCVNLLTGTLTFGVVQQLRNQPAGIGAAMAQGLRTFPSVIGTGIVAGLRIMLFFLLLVVPGIMQACRLFVAVPAAVMERGGVSRSIERSGVLTDGSRWQMFAAWLITMMIALGLPYTGVYLFVTFGTEELPWWITDACTLISAPIAATAAAVAYFQLRMAKENVDADQIAAVFD